MKMAFICMGSAGGEWEFEEVVGAEGAGALSVAELRRGEREGGELRAGGVGDGEGEGANELEEAVASVAWDEVDVGDEFGVER